MGQGRRGKKVIITSEALGHMRACKRWGMKFEDIGRVFGVSTMTAYRRITGKKHEKVYTPKRTIDHHKKNPLVIKRRPQLRVLTSRV